MSVCIFESPNFMFYKIINYCLYFEIAKCTAKIMILVYYSSFMTKRRIVVITGLYVCLVPNSYLRGDIVLELLLFSIFLFFSISIMKEHTDQGRNSVLFSKDL
ncbi:hypothetical protein TTRE_0000909601 [Trichuris trichiura]|uniref:Uncharacterized protein n=1 Tax=Trichuris trichiura TaxID=36087 RepID=A0A077ZPP0_TRITR|nr:hypothetical protein TTRE_0000909601 [Trichuris trichiura]